MWRGRENVQCRPDGRDGRVKVSYPPPSARTARTAVPATVDMHAARHVVEARDGIRGGLGRSPDGRVQVHGRRTGPLEPRVQRSRQVELHHPPVGVVGTHGVYGGLLGLDGGVQVRQCPALVGNRVRSADRSW